MTELTSSQSLLGMVGRLFDTGRYSDVAILVGPEQYRFNVHKNIIAGRSSVFDVMLQKRWMERQQGCQYTTEEENGSVTILHLPNQSMYSFRIFLRYLYTDKLEYDCEKGLEIDLQILELAHFYDVPKLLRLMLDQVKGGIDAANCLEIYARTKNIDDKLMDLCLECLFKNIRYVGANDQFLLWESEIVQTILGQDILDVREIDLFKALVKWANHSEDENKPEKASRHSKLPELLKLIRFPLIGIKDFATEVIPTGVFTPETIMQMFLHFANPEMMPTKYGTSPRQKSSHVQSPMLEFALGNKKSQVYFHIRSKALIDQPGPELKLRVSGEINLNGIVVHSSQIFQLIMDLQTVTFQVVVKCDDRIIFTQHATQLLKPPKISENLEIIFQTPILLVPKKYYAFTVTCTTNTPYGGPLQPDEVKQFWRKQYYSHSRSSEIPGSDLVATISYLGKIANSSWIKNLIFSQEVSPPQSEPCIIS